jgi:hypothetical protein
MSDNALVTQDQNSTAIDQVTAEQIRQHVIALRDGAKQGLNEIWTAVQAGQDCSNALTVVDEHINALVEFGDQASAIVDGYQAMVGELASQRDQAMENFKELEGTVDELQEQAYNEGLSHIWDCDECQAELRQYFQEAEDEEVGERADDIAGMLRLVGKGDVADKIENKAAELIRLREEVDKLIDDGETLFLQERHKQHAVVVNIGEDDELDDSEN